MKLCDAPRARPPETPDEAAEERYDDAQYAIDCRKRAVRENMEVALDCILARCPDIEWDDVVKQIAADKDLNPKEWVLQLLTESFEDLIIPLPDPQDEMLEEPYRCEW
jgi:hypothetical protein